MSSDGMKLCGGCNTRKPLEEFHRNKAARDGRQTRCKPCMNRTCRENRKLGPKCRRQIGSGPGVPGAAAPAV
jgi:hypothetical protein